MSNPQGIPNRIDRQDEDRRQQQADERVRELEQENERLREVLAKIRSQANDMDAEGLETRDIWLTAHRALDGGGGHDE